jgi:hypothetical protein
MDAISVNAKFRVGAEVGYCCPFCSPLSASKPRVIHWYRMGSRSDASVIHHDAVSIHLIVPSTVQILASKPE